MLINDIHKRKDKPYGYDECYKTIREAILEKPIQYEPFTAFFNIEQLDSIKAKYGKVLFDECMSDVEFYELPAITSEFPIKTLRQRLKMNQKEFAAYLSIPVSTIRSWEQNRRKPPDYIINLIERMIRAEKSLERKQ